MSAGRRRLVAVVGLLLACAAGGLFFWWRHGPPAPPPELPAELDADVRVVLQHAREQVLARPNSAEEWGRLGRLLRAHELRDASNVCFDRAARLAPNDSRWPYLLADDALYRDPAAALPPLRRAVELGHPDPAYRAAARLRLAEALLQRQEVDEAEKHFLAAQADDAGPGRTRYGLAVIALTRNRPAEALRLLEAIPPGLFTRRKVALQLAMACRRLGDGRAAGYERQANAGTEDLPWPDPYIAEYNHLEQGRSARFALVDSFEGTGRLRQAEQVLREMAVTYPDARTFAALGINLAKQSRHADAEQVFRELLRLDAEHIQGRYFLGVVLFFQAERAGKKEAAALYQSAADETERATRLKPDHALAHVFRGRALAALGRLDAALASFEAAVKCRPDFSETHYRLGDALAVAGRRAEALPHLETAARLADGRDPGPRKRLEQVWEELAGKGRR